MILSCARNNPVTLPAGSCVNKSPAKVETFLLYVIMIRTSKMDVNEENAKNVNLMGIFD